MELIALAALLGLALLGNFALLVLLRRAKKTAQKALDEALEAARKKRPLSVEAGELLQDLVSQGAVLRIERIDPEHLFMLRPR
jgi:hypothetical protein